MCNYLSCKKYKLLSCGWRTPISKRVSIEICQALRECYLIPGWTSKLPAYSASQKVWNWLIEGYAFPANTTIISWCACIAPRHEMQRSPGRLGFLLPSFQEHHSVTQAWLLAGASYVWPLLSKQAASTPEAWTHAACLSNNNPTHTLLWIKNILSKTKSKREWQR